jgi:hypothetical protein
MHLLLTLHPQEDRNRTCTPSALVESKDGSFQLTECLPGRYKAALAATGVQKGEADRPGPGSRPTRAGSASLPKAYLDAQSSPWEVTVPEGGMDDLILTVSSR